MSEDAITTFVQALGDYESARLTEEAGKQPVPPIVDEDPTARALKEMLTENTGVHICDSGGAYGRSWQRNRDKNLADEEPCSCTGSEWINSKGKKNFEFEINFSVYHYLKAHLEIVPDNDPVVLGWKEFLETDKDMHWTEAIEEFPKWLKKKAPYMRVVSEDGLTNTYNYGGDFLSQIILYSLFIVDQHEYVLLQIHGGCDVRGGYTDPRLFRVTNESLDMVRAAWCQCPACEVKWYTDNCGSTWAPDGLSKKRRKGFKMKELGEYKLKLMGENGVQCPVCKKAALKAGWI